MHFAKSGEPSMGALCSGKVLGRSHSAASIMVRHSDWVYRFVMLISNSNPVVFGSHSGLDVEIAGWSFLLLSTLKHLSVMIGAR